MKRQINRYLKIFFVFVIVSISYSNNEFEKIVISLSNKIITKWQYSPHEIDDIYSILVYDDFINKMDYERKYFLKSDIDKFDLYREKLDDLLFNYNSDFFDLFVSLWKERLLDISSFLSNMELEDLDFSSNDAIETDPKKRDFLISKTQVLDEWKNRFKLQILRKYLSLSKADTTINIPNLNNEYNAEIFDKAFYTEKKNINRRLTRLISQERSEIFAIFMNSFTQTFDPHTSYYAPERKEDFDISISGRLEGIGARLREDEGYIKVVDIIPGGAAWRQGELMIDDLIIEVAQENEEPVNIEEWRSRDAVKLIRGKKGTEVKLTIKRANGISKVIKIIRDIVIIEDTYSKSLILRHKLINKKIGYVNLPKFYHDFNNEEGRSCAEDIKNDLVKFNDAEIDGLIFDLRNNGGGALEDVVKMGGFFIKDGPIVQVNGKNNRKKVLSDNDESIIFDKPLVFIVNQYSASASEILASAMQDYNRAIVVGSIQTFGKGTVQRFINLDQFLSKAQKNYSPIGSLKLTIQKFYRINGESTQHKGVIPDIVLPFVNDYDDIGERSLDNYLEWDTISKANYNKLERNTKLIDILKENSKSRVMKNQYFKEIMKRRDILEAREKKSFISVNKKKFVEKAVLEYKEFEDHKKVLEDFENYDLLDIEQIYQTSFKDDISSEKEKKFEDKLKSDFYLNETIFILNDLINETY